MAPEYALLGQLTKKADVYSFGILVLEVISGGSSSRAAFTDELLVLVEWVKLINSNTLTHNIYYVNENILNFVVIGLGILPDIQRIELK